MNAVPPLPGRPRLSPGVHTQRCVRHSVREAVARCPSCHGYFCRECVVEHEGRLLCAACLARSLVAKPGAFSKWSVGLNHLKLVGALAFAWMVFYLLGSLLLRIPPAFHDGSAWSSITEDNADP